MSAGTRLCIAIVAAGLISVPGTRTATTQSREPRPRQDFDIREGRPAAAPRVQPELPARRTPDGRQTVRLNRDSGSARVLQASRWAVTPMSGAVAIRGRLAANARELGLDPRDVATLIPVRDYTSRSNGVRHVEFRQIVDGYPVFDSSVTVHLRPDGSVARITSNAAPLDGRSARVAISGADARTLALSHAGDGDAGPESLVWLPVDGTLRLAWHVTVTARDTVDEYDVLVDADTTELLVRRNRVLQIDGSGRVLQSSSDPRLPDPMPIGQPGSGCPPPSNHVMRSLNAPFRDAPAVLGNTGRLEGNNVRIFRGGEPSSTGTFDGNGWVFDYPFNAAGSAETFLFFAMNFAHDFFYDLGFDEAAGNFQADNFGRGGLGGDPVNANARAGGRNNANYVHQADGSSPTINMFLWDGTGCWAADVDNNGSLDLDGDYDLDIIVHEYHHGVNLRLNTSWTGKEAGAIGEGGGDFFAYSVNGDTVLAEYSRPGGLRGVNAKHYGDWSCLLGLICEVHANGEIWANVLWDVRERFRTELVRGSEAAAVNESHQLYIDGLALSPPAPTMLDLRDAMLEADGLRNPSSPVSQNFCRLWESFAGRGMGLSATDTADNGLNQVGPAYDVPDGCIAPPSPPSVTITALSSTAVEAGMVPAVMSVTRAGGSFDAPLTVKYRVGGSASAGADYTALPGTITIPAGAAAAEIPILPIDDTLVENNESVVVTLLLAGGYIISSPFSATVSIVSDDVAPDMVISALTSPRTASGGGTIEVTATTRNQDLGAAPASQTWFYLSTNSLADAADPLLGTQAVPALAPDAAFTGTMSLTLPGPLDAGTYYLIAKADAPGDILETSEFNNTRALSVAIGPDLAVASISAPAIAAPGGSILVSETTANQGGGAAPPSVTRFFLSSNVVLDANDAPLESRDVPQLAAGSSSTGSTAVPIPSDATVGTYYLIAQADATSTVTEANEINNARYALIRIGPDLTVSALTVPVRAGAGLTIGISDTTRNAGAGQAAPSTTAFYLSSNYQLDGGDIRLNGSRSVPSLASNQSSTGTTSVTIPDVGPGTWIIIASADDEKTVPEIQETNNARFASILIGPDLNIQSASSPLNAAAGTSVNVGAVARNSGGGAAGPSVLRFYLSTNLALDSTDVQLNAVRQVGPLAPGATESGTTSVTLPSNVVGTMYLLIVADADQNVVEANEQNNVYARYIQIGGGS